MNRALLFSLLVFGLALVAASFTRPTSGHGVGVMQGSPAWGRQTSGTTNELRSVHFVSENEGWAVGANATLLRTTNGGSSWSSVNLNVDPTKGFSTVRCLNQNVCWVGGATIVGRTLNNGANWTTAPLPTTGLVAQNPVRVSFFPVLSDAIWAAGSATGALSGSLTLFRLDAGGNAIKDFDTGSNIKFNDVHFLATNNGWAIGEDGGIMRLNPVGSTGISPTFHFGASGQNAIFMVNSTTGWIVGNNGAILKTTNGTSWNALTSGTTANLRDVHFLDANRGWAVGDGGAILTTSDGGATWATEQSGVTANLRGVYFVNDNTGFAVGDGGMILKRGAPSGPAVVTTVSAASFTGTGLSAESIAAAFGQGFATATEVATSVPLPTTLAGASVQVRDSAGADRAAPLFFVAPGQINYLIPPGTANGSASISVVRGESVVATGTAPIATIAPGLFAANANGQGVAAAVVFRRKANGAESFESVARFDQAQNRFVPLPIDLGPETDQIFLILFGTGYRARTSLAAVACQIGGVVTEVLFAGEAPGLVGVDQTNVRLPRTLAGRGEVDVALTVEGRTANTVTVAFSGTPVCSYSISPSERSLSAAAGTGSVNVTAPNGCAWTATSNASWLTISAGAAGNGNGVVIYAIVANTGASQRSGMLTIAGQTFTVTQAAGVQAISVGQLVTGSLTTDDLTHARGGRTYSYDAYRFSVTSANTTVAIDLRSAQFDAAILLYREESNRLTEIAQDDESGGYGNGKIENNNALLFTVLSAPGDYVIFATSSDFAPPGLGSYTLRLNTNVMQNIVYGANLANASISTTDIQTSAGVYLDAYWFTGQQGDEVQIRMNSLAFDSFLILQGNDGDPPIASDDNSGGGKDALIRFRLRASGNYLIIATPYAQNLTGAYMITLNKTAGTAAKPDQFARNARYISERSKRANPKHNNQP